MGVVESQVSIGPDRRNLGLTLKTEPVKKKTIRMYPPGLTAAPGLSVERSVSEYNVLRVTKRFTCEKCISFKIAFGMV